MIIPSVLINNIIWSWIKSLLKELFIFWYAFIYHFLFLLKLKLNNLDRNSQISINLLLNLTKLIRAGSILKEKQYTFKTFKSYKPLIVNRVGPTTSSIGLFNKWIVFYWLHVELRTVKKSINKDKIGATSSHHDLKKGRLLS